MEDAELRELEEHVLPQWRERFRNIVAMTDACCAAELNEEFRDVCREMAAVCCQDGSPAMSGKVESWAAGIVYCVGWVNFVTDPSQTPHVKSEQIARGCGTSPATMQAKAKVIREGLELVQFDPEWTVRSRLADNPYLWMLQTTDGLIIDIRYAPREVQEEALRRGLIPYIPSDEDEAD